MSFTGNEGQSISLSTAGNMTLAFRNSIIINFLTGLLNPLFPTSFTMSKSGLQSLINQTDAVGVRFYHGVTTLGVHTLIAVAADDNEDDLTGGIILDATGSSTTLTAAGVLTAAFRTAIGNSGEPEGHFIGKNNLQDLLDQQGTASIRVYKGFDGNNEMSLVLIGVDSGNDDMTQGLIMDNFAKCPPTCSSSNSLNS